MWSSFRHIRWAAALVVLTLAVLHAGSRASHAQSLQDRIRAASDGDTLVVHGGTHHGPFVVDASVVLLGRERPHLRGDTTTHVVRVEAPGVTLRGFEVSHSGRKLNRDHAGILVTARRATLRDNYLHDVLHGIYVKGADDVRAVQNRIRGLQSLARPQRGNGIHLWKSVGNDLSGNRIAHTRDGIYFSFADSTRAADNVVHDVRYGLHFMYSDANQFAGNLFYDNASGSALMYSKHLSATDNVFRDNRTKNGYGLLLQSLEQSTFTGNQLVRNTTGLYLENSTANTFRENVIRANHRGFRLSGSSMRNRFTENRIRSNVQTAALSGLDDANTWSVDGRGNDWGAHGLIDLDADGVSELPRHVVDVLGASADGFPYTALLASSPGVETLAFALRRAPPPNVPSIVDPHPLVRSSGGSGSLPLGALAVAAVLLAGAALLTRPLTL